MTSEDIHLPNDPSATPASGSPTPSSGAPGQTTAAPTASTTSPAPHTGSRTNRLSKDEFARRFRESWRVLWCIAAGETSDRSSADDVVQQAALVALERLDDFDPSTSFLAWMAQIVRYTAMNEVQKVRRRRTSSTDPATMDTAPSPAHPVENPRTDKPSISSFGQLLTDQNVFDDRLIAALRTLDTVARSCLLMRIVLDTPYKEISLVLGIPPGTAMSHVDRARRSLRLHLTGQSDATLQHHAPSSGRNGGTP